MSPFRAAPLAALILLAVPLPASAQPSCAEGPQTVGTTIVGTPCNDTIHVPRGVTKVQGEGGDDTIYGGRGNQRLFGGEGNDRLFGGIGDDMLRGGPGDDMLSGGFGADSLDGEEGSDYVRGDATIDAIGDSGVNGTDTLSFATGVTPGYPNAGNFGYTGFPEGADGRGVFIELGDDFANDGLAPNGGGVDEPLAGRGGNFEAFERVIGTPFSDFIVGTSGNQTIYGGGGADVILGKGGNDEIFGGEEGDFCEEASETTLHECEFGSERRVASRNPATVSAGRMAPGEPAALYLAGSDGNDAIVATLSGSNVSFTNHGSPVGSVSLSEPPDSVVLAGLRGNDSLSAEGFPESTSIVELGGENEDELAGTEAEDVLVDGPGDDTVAAGGGDDAVPNNEGADNLRAGAGNDLFISNAVCEGDVLDGGEGVDNANWANFDSGVSLDLVTHEAGLVGPDGKPQCSIGTPTRLNALEDIEGSNNDDTLIGDAGPNQLLGRPGADSYFAQGGNDSILANSGDSDRTIDCGEGWDTALIDIPTARYADPAPIECEDVEERPVNSFRPPGTPPAPEPVATTSTTVPPDREPPRTRLLHRPPSVLYMNMSARRRTVSIAFASNEPNSTFRCKLDRGTFKPCRSPRHYRVGLNRHTVRVFAIDPAGNRDSSPLLVSFRVRRR